MEQQTILNTSTLPTSISPYQLTTDGLVCRMDYSSFIFIVIVHLTFELALMFLAAIAISISKLTGHAKLTLYYLILTIQCLFVAPYISLNENCTFSPLFHLILLMASLAIGLKDEVSATTECLGHHNSNIVTALLLSIYFLIPMIIKVCFDKSLFCILLGVVFITKIINAIALTSKIHFLNKQAKLHNVELEYQRYRLSRRENHSERQRIFGSH